MRLNADLERRVAERTTELTAANRELEAFSYSVSHDLRAPLRSIDGFALALLEDHGDALAPGARQYIDIVRQESQRMGQLIDDLLGLARLSRGTLNRGVVNVSAIAADIVAELRRRQSGRDVRVVVAPDMVLRGDANLLRIALENLIGNAWKFTSRRADARIEIGMQARGATPLDHHRRQRRRLRPAARRQAVPTVRAPASGVGVRGHGDRARDGRAHHQEARRQRARRGRAGRRRHLRLRAANVSASATADHPP